MVSSLVLGLHPAETLARVEVLHPKAALLMISILHYLKDPKRWELWPIPCYGYCRIDIINRMTELRGL